MNQRIRSFCLALLAAALFQATSHADWQAGVARVDITPQQAMWLSGYASRDRPADGKLTDLWAKALALQDDDGHRAVMVTIDLIGLDRHTSQRICRAVAQRTGLPRAALALCCTHTHTGPVVGENLRSMYFLDQQHADHVKAYTDTLVEKLTDLVARALADLAPAKLSWTSGTATFAVNRRNNPAALVPKLRAEGKLKGPVDHDVPVLLVHDTDGRLRCLVCGYACHATVLSSLEYSGDWPGFAQIELEQKHDGTVAMVWAGCGADQNPLPRRSVDLAKAYGRQLAEAVARAIDGPTQPIDGHLACQYGEIDLTFASLPTREELNKAAASTNRYEAARAKNLAAQWDRDGQLSPTYPFPVQFWRLGDGPRIAILGGEVVVDLSLRLKRELGAGTWVAAYANDVMAYIPSERVLREGGYEGASAMLYYGLPSAWAVGVEQCVVDEVLRQAAACDKR